MGYGIENKGEKRLKIFIRFGAHTVSKTGDEHERCMLDMGQKRNSIWIECMKIENYTIFRFDFALNHAQRDLHGKRD